MTKRRCTAYHEAGHAVMSIVLGLSVNSVTIVRSRDSLGCVKSPPVLGYEDRTRSGRRRLARAHIVSSYAGLEAQKLVDPDPKDFAGEHDDENARWLSREYHVFPRILNCVGDEYHEAYLERLRGEARRLVRKHRPAIDAVAEALLIGWTMGHEAVAQIVRSVLGSEPY